MLNEDQIISSNQSKPISNESNSIKYSNSENFISDLTNAYKAAGITNEDLLKLLIGQDALETNWGKNPVGDYNFGNIIVTPSFKGKYKEALDNGNKNVNEQKSSPWDKSAPNEQGIFQKSRFL